MEQEKLLKLSMKGEEFKKNVILLKMNNKSLMEPNLLNINDYYYHFLCYIK
jgi:hypothetical protein